MTQIQKDKRKLEDDIGKLVNEFLRKNPAHHVQFISIEKSIETLEDSTRFITSFKIKTNIELL